MDGKYFIRITTSASAFVMLLTLVSAASAQGPLRPSPFGDPSTLLAASVEARETAWNDMVAYWTFDEGNGVTLLDSSGEKNIGVIKGSPTWVSGLEGTALSFDGEEDHIAVDDSVSLDLSHSFTVSAWVRPTEPRLGAILSKNGYDRSARGGYELDIDRNAFIYSIAGRASLGAASALIAPNSWVHVAVVYEKEREPSTELYIDGERTLSGSVSFPTDNDEELLIGTNHKGNYFKGTIDELRIYSRAFSATEVKELYTAYDVPADREVSEPDTSGTSNKKESGLFSFFRNVYQNLSHILLWDK